MSRTKHGKQFERNDLKKKVAKSRVADTAAHRHDSTDKIRQRHVSAGGASPANLRFQAPAWCPEPAETQCISSILVKRKQVTRQWASPPWMCS